MENNQRPQRANLGWTFAIAAALAAVTVIGAGAVIMRIDRTTERIARLEERIGHMEERIGRMEVATAEIPGKLSQQLLELNRTILMAVTSGRNAAPEPQTPDLPRRPDFGAMGAAGIGAPGIGAPSLPRMRVPPTPSWALPGGDGEPGVPPGAEPPSGLK